jgi:hypothetical protein
MLLPAGAEDGSIKVWNVRGGALLSTLGCGPQQASGSQWGSGSGVEVTGLAVASSTDTNGQAAACIVATGWDRKVRHHDPRVQYVMFRGENAAERVSA